MKFMALVVAVGLLAGACGGIDGDVGLDEQITTGDDRDEFLDGLNEGFEGTLVPSETECVLDALLASGKTPNELTSLNLDPTAAFEFYSTIMPDCVDSSLDIDAPIDGELKDGLLDGFVAGGLTETESVCLFDALVEEGFDGRDFIVGAYLPEATADMQNAVAVAFPPCDGQ